MNEGAGTIKDQGAGTKKLNCRDGAVETNFRLNAGEVSITQRPNLKRTLVMEHNLEQN
jgi:hypothetical protein